MTGIILRKGTKAYFDENPPKDGELVFCIDTDEIGSSQGSEVQWQEWDYQTPDEILTTGATTGMTVPTAEYGADGDKYNYSENGTLHEYKKESGSWREIEYGTSSEYVQNTFSTDKNLLLGQRGDFHMGVGYVPSFANDIATKGYLASKQSGVGGSGTIKLDGSVSEMDIGYTAVNDGDILTKNALLQGDLQYYVPPFDPLFVGALWNDDGTPRISTINGLKTVTVPSVASNGSSAGIYDNGEVIFLSRAPNLMVTDFSGRILEETTFPPNGFDWWDNSCGATSDGYFYASKYLQSTNPNESHICKLNSNLEILETYIEPLSNGDGSRVSSFSVFENILVVSYPGTNNRDGMVILLDKNNLSLIREINHPNSVSAKQFGSSSCMNANYIFTFCSEEKRIYILTHLGAQVGALDLPTWGCTMACTTNTLIVMYSGDIFYFDLRNGIEGLTPEINITSGGHDERIFIEDNTHYLADHNNTSVTSVDLNTYIVSELLVPSKVSKYNFDDITKLSGSMFATINHSSEALNFMRVQ